MEMERKIEELLAIAACPDCDLLLREPSEVRRGRRVICPRCGHVLYTVKRNAVEKTLALSLTGLLLYIPANFMPLMTLDTLGLEKKASLYDGVLALFQHDYLFVGLIVALTSLVFPLVKVSLLFLVAASLKFRLAIPHLAGILRCYLHLDEWGMLEVYMVGILVSIVKLYHMAHIQYDVGVVSFVLLLLATLGASVTVDEHLFWQLIEQRQGAAHG